MGWFKIGDLFTLQMGKTPARSNSSFWGNGHIWVSISDLSNCNKYIASSRELITDDAVQESGIRIVPQGTLIMSFKLSLGKTAITASNLYTNEAIMAFIDKKIVPLDINYVYHLFNNWDWSRATNKAVMGLTLNKATLSQIKIPIPSLNTQKAIANILDKIDESITLRKRQLEIFNQLVKSRFLERFGEPGVNDKEFPCYPVGQIAESVTYGTSALASNSGQYEYLRMNNLTDNGQLDLSDLKRIDMSDEQAEKYMVKKGDILFNRTNSIDLVGKTALFNLNTPMIIAGYLIRIRLSDKVNPVYFTAYMNMPYMKEKLRNMAKGAVNQANINSKELKSIQILIPPLSLQNEYCNFVLSIDKSKMAVQKSLDELETLKKSLMQTYFG